MPNCAGSVSRNSMAAATATLACLAAAPALAAVKPAKAEADRPGGVDSAVVSRYQGSVLSTYADTRLAGSTVIVEQKGKLADLPVEGKISSRIYFAPAGATPLEVYRNYRQALQGAGFETLYSCEVEECKKTQAQNMVSTVARAAQWVAGGRVADDAFNSGNQPGFFYYSGRKNGAGGATYVTVATSNGWADAPVLGRVRQFIQVVEPAATELGKVKVDARAIGAGLQRDGKMALYGVTFDTDKAVIREESAAQLAEMAAALKAAPAMKVFIVGHTDNQGELAANTALSQKRAEAVLAALSGKYGIAPARLLARGVANLSPVANNQSEEGRAKNRRVEMVVR